MIKELIIISIQILAFIGFVWGISLIYFPLAVIVGSILLFLGAHAAEAYIDEFLAVKNEYIKPKEEGKLTDDGFY